MPLDVASCPPGVQEASPPVENRWPESSSRRRGSTQGLRADLLVRPMGCGSSHGPPVIVQATSQRHPPLTWSSVTTDDTCSDRIILIACLHCCRGHGTRLWTLSLEPFQRDRGTGGPAVSTHTHLPRPSARTHTSASTPLPISTHVQAPSG